MMEPLDPELEIPDQPNPDDYAFDLNAALDCVV